MDKNKSADWLAIPVNSVITLSDAQGIQDSMKRGRGVHGLDYTVQSAARLVQVDGLSTHLFLTLKDEEQPVYLLVKMVDEIVDLYVFFDIPGLDGGTRQELIDRGLLWLFQQPPDPNRFDPADLRYSMSVQQTVPGPKGDQVINYNLKPQGELQCRYTEVPPRSGMPLEMLATAVEYRAVQPTENPEFLVLEVGDREGKRSLVQFYLGCSIKLSEVDVLPA